MPEPKGRKTDEISETETAEKAGEVTAKADSVADSAAKKKPSDHKRRGQKDESTGTAKETSKKINAFGEEEDQQEPERRITGPGTRRWVAPTFVVVGLLGVAWLVVYYLAGRDVPVMNKLGDWNILIGMGLMAASLGLSMLWK